MSSLGVTARRSYRFADAVDTADGDHRKRRRNRTTHSCINCHTSKRKCDRKRPCQRCVQLGLTGLCVYEVGNPSIADDPSVDQVTRLQNRIAELEGVIRELKNKPHPRWTTALSNAQSGILTVNGKSIDDKFRSLGSDKFHTRRASALGRRPAAIAAEMAQRAHRLSEIALDGDDSGHDRDASGDSEASGRIEVKVEAQQSDLLELDMEVMGDDLDGSEVDARAHAMGSRFSDSLSPRPQPRSQPTFSFTPAFGHGFEACDDQSGGAARCGDGNPGSAGIGGPAYALTPPLISPNYDLQSFPSSASISSNELSDRGSPASRLLYAFADASGHGSPGLGMEDSLLGLGMGNGAGACPCMGNDMAYEALAGLQIYLRQAAGMLMHLPEHQHGQQQDCLITRYLDDLDGFIQNATRTQTHTPAMSMPHSHPVTPAHHQGVPLPHSTPAHIHSHPMTPALSQSHLPTHNSSHPLSLPHSPPQSEQHGHPHPHHAHTLPLPAVSHTARAAFANVLRNSSSEPSLKSSPESTHGGIVGGFSSGLASAPPTMTSYSTNHSPVIRGIGLHGAHSPPSASMIMATHAQSHPGSPLSHEIALQQQQQQHWDAQVNPNAAADATDAFMSYYHAQAHQHHHQHQQQLQHEALTMSLQSAMAS